MLGVCSMLSNSLNPLLTAALTKNTAAVGGVVGAALMPDDAMAQGDPGQKGEKGAAGEKGVKGDTGPTGATGPKGDQGVTGPKGDQGDTGAAGTAGLKGDPGQKGEPGAQGDPGMKGGQGEQGVKGEVGEKGEVGVTGEKGEVGEKGATGAGTPGAQGATGATGSQGPQGATGAKGEKGVAGQAAAKGEKGATGQAGVAGQPGSIGVDGADGAPGEKGDSGLTSLTQAHIQNAAENLKNSSDPDDRRVGELLERIAEQLTPSAAQPSRSDGSGGSAAPPTSDGLALLRHAARTDDPVQRSSALMGSIFLNQEDIRKNRADIRQNRESIETLRHQYRNLRGQSREGTALAIALGGIHVPVDKDRSVSLRFGYFESEEALALGASFRLEENWQIDFGMGHGLRYEQRGYSGGLSYSW